MGVGAPDAHSQSATKNGESVMLPPPSGQGQPAPSPIHATSWSVISIVESGRAVAVPRDAVVFFDWGIGLGESFAYVHDGCFVSKSVFVWTSTEMSFSPKDGNYGASSCIPGPGDTFRRSFTGSFTHGVPAVASPGATMTLFDGNRSIELVRRPESPLAGTAWITVDSIPQRGRAPISGLLSFGPTTFGANDGCNSIGGLYLQTSRSVLALGASETLADCRKRSLGWRGAPAQFSVTRTMLTIGIGPKAVRYRKITAVPFPGPLLGPPDPTATAPFTTAAVFGSWRVASLAGGKTGSGVVGTLEFRSDGSLLGETPCETLFGTWTQAAISMATTIQSLTRDAKPCDEALKPDALALGDMLANKQLAIGRGDIRLTLWKAGDGGTNLGIQLVLG